MMNRRTFTRLAGTSLAGVSVAGCSGSGNADAGASPTTSTTPDIAGSETDTRVRFSDLEWGSHCVPSPCMWSLQAVVENLTGEILVVGYVLTIQMDNGPEEYTGVVRVDGWGKKTIIIRTNIPDTGLEPFEYELRPVKVPQPPIPTPVANPEDYARIVKTVFYPSPSLPKVVGTVRNISEVTLSRVVIRGTFYIGDRAAESANIIERDLRPDEEREFTMRYFRGNEAREVDDIEVVIAEVVL